MKNVLMIDAFGTRALDTIIARTIVVNYTIKKKQKKEKRTCSYGLLKQQ